MKNKLEYGVQSLQPKYNKEITKEALTIWKRMSALRHLPTEVRQQWATDFYNKHKVRLYTVIEGQIE